MIVKCPECGSKGRLGKEFAGREVLCPQCGVEFIADQENFVQTEVKWYYAEGREKRGPIGRDQFESLIGSGAITPGTLVWSKGMKGWQPLAEVRALKKPRTVAAEGPLFSRELEEAESSAAEPGGLHRNYAAETASGLNYAGAGRRLGAKIIDLIFLLTLASIIEGLGRKLFPEAYVPAEIDRVFVVIVAVVFLIWAFYLTWFVGRFGATPGKIVFNLRIVTPNGGRVDYARAFGRFCGEFVLALSLALAAAIEAFTLNRQKWPAVASFMAALFLFYSPILFDSQKRGLHDRLSGTRVVVV